MKKSRSIIPLALFMMLLTACGTSGAVSSVSPGSAEAPSSSSVTSSESEEQQAAKQVVLDFFAAAETEDYPTMKGLCTAQFVTTFFKESQGNTFWFGYQTVTPTSVELISDPTGDSRNSLFPSAKSGYLVDTTFTGKAAPGSALWTTDAEVLDGACIFLVQKIDNAWKISDIETG